MHGGGDQWLDNPWDGILWFLITRMAYCGASGAADGGVFDSGGSPENWG